MPAGAPALAADLSSEELVVARPPALRSPHPPQEPARGEQPSAEAELRMELRPEEECTVEINFPRWLGGGTIKLNTRTSAGSSLAMAVTVVLLTASGCFIAGTAAAIGAPMWAIIGSLLIPVGVFAIVRLLHRTK